MGAVGAPCANSAPCANLSFSMSAPRLLTALVLYCLIYWGDTTSSPVRSTHQQWIRWSNVAAGVLLWSGGLPQTSHAFLPSRDDLPSISIPAAITKLHPLPEEELFRSYAQANADLVSGRFVEALEELNKAADVGPQVADVFLTRGIVNEKLLRWDDAIADYRRAMALKENRLNPFAQPDPTLLNNLANAETGKLQWAEALRDFSRAVEISPKEYVAPQLGRALVLHELGRIDEARQYFVALVAKYPSFADGLAALSIMTFEAGEVDAALDLWDRALQEDSRYSEIEWVSEIRRWPPSLVSSLKLFQSQVLASRTFI